jgi:hypothetical protein
LHRHAATLRCLFDAIYVSNSRLAVDICVSARDAGAPRVVVVRPAICGTTVDRQRRFSCHCRWPDAYARQPVAEPPNSRRGVCCLSVPVRPLHPVMYVALLHVRVRTPRGRVGARARTAGTLTRDERDFALGRFADPSYGCGPFSFVSHLSG